MSISETQGFFPCRTRFAISSGIVPKFTLMPSCPAAAAFREPRKDGLSLIHLQIISDFSGKRDVRLFKHRGRREWRGVPRRLCETSVFYAVCKKVANIRELFKWLVSH